MKYIHTNRLLAAATLWSALQAGAQAPAASSPAPGDTLPTVAKTVKCLFGSPTASPLATQLRATCIAQHASTGRVLSSCTAVKHCSLTFPIALQGIRIWSPDSLYMPPLFQSGPPTQVTFPLLARKASKLKGPWLTELTSSSVVVRWETDTAAESVTRLASPPASAVPVVPQWLQGSSTCDGASCVHSVPVTGLDADRPYAFVVGDVKTAAPFYQHPGGSVVTAPMQGEYGFAVLGDVQAQSEGDLAWTVWRDLSATTPGLQSTTGHSVGPVFHVGDMTTAMGAANAAEISKRWTRLFADGATMLSRHPFYPAIGNNDDPASFNKYFGARGSAGAVPYYSIAYGRTHFVILNANSTLTSNQVFEDREFKSCTTQPTAQASWFRNDIALAAARDNIDHIVIIAHWGPKTYGMGPYPENSDLHGCLKSMFIGPDQAPTAFFRKLRLVFSGHQHYYQRVVKEHQVGTQQRKIHYVTVGTAGAGPRCFNAGTDLDGDNAADLKASSASICKPTLTDPNVHFQGITVDLRGTGVVLRAYDFAYHEATQQKVSVTGTPLLDCVVINDKGDSTACPP